MVFLRVDRACSSVLLLLTAVMARQGASGQVMDYDRASPSGRHFGGPAPGGGFFLAPWAGTALIEFGLFRRVGNPTD